MKWVVLLALITLGCASHARLMSEVKSAHKWDVFWFDKGEIKIMVIPDDEWTFHDGCFHATKPVPYIQCEVFRIRPCTEDCG